MPPGWVAWNILGPGLVVVSRISMHGAAII